MAKVSMHDEPAEMGRCRLFAPLAPCDISLGVLALLTGLPLLLVTTGSPWGEAEEGRSRAARIFRNSFAFQGPKGGGSY